jgi:hypothetical protein
VDLTTTTVALCATLCFQTGPCGQAAGPGRADTKATHLDLRINPFMDMHCYVRSRAACGADVPELDGLPQAIETVRQVEAQFDHPGTWGLFEALWSPCQSAGEALERAALFPETHRLRLTGTQVAVREPALKLARAYVRLERAFRESVWPKHKAALEAARDKLQKELIPKQASCFNYLVEKLGMQDPRLEIPVVLVAQAPPPGSFTLRPRGDAPVCIVSAPDPADPFLCEIVLHEAIHALDVATSDQPTALQTLRAKLPDAGVDLESPIYRDVPHTLIFVQAAETVRRVLDPGHAHYGDARGYYAKVPEVANAVRAPWTDYLDGKISRDEAIQRIVAAARKSAPAQP